MPSFIDRLSERVGIVASWFYAGAAALIWLEVALRYLLAKPTSWTQEIVIALCASAFVLGGAYCMRRGQHIRIGFVVDGRGAAAHRLSAALSLIAGAIFLAGLLWGAWGQLVESVWTFDETRWMPETTGRAWDVPLPPVIRAVLVAAVALFLAQALLVYLRTLRGRDA
jgi:TRAP-type C4-dicarboxylate transport system permease small subunit